MVRSWHNRPCRRAVQTKDAPPDSYGEAISLSRHYGAMLPPAEFTKDHRLQVLMFFLLCIFSCEVYERNSKSSDEVFIQGNER